MQEIEIGDINFGQILFEYPKDTKFKGFIKHPRIIKVFYCLKYQPRILEEDINIFSKADFVSLENSHGDWSQKSAIFMLNNPYGICDPSKLEESKELVKRIEIEKIWY